jgi:hypothetical protein
MRLIPWTLRSGSEQHFLVKKQHDLEENNFGFVDILHHRYKLRRYVEQTPLDWLKSFEKLQVVLCKFGKCVNQ